MAPPRKSGTVESETVSSRSSRTETSSSSKGSSKSPAKTARGSMARSRSQSGSRAAPSGRSPGRPPTSPKKQHTPRKASHSPAKKAATRSPARKSPARKSPAKKSPARKSPPAKSPARKSPARPVGRPRSPAKPKSPARKSPGRKSPAPKSPARKSVAPKSPAKKTPAKTTRASSKSPARTTQRKKSVSPAREKKELSPKAVTAQSPASLMSSPGASSSEGGSEVRRRSTLLSTISSLGALPTVNLGNSLTRRSTTATSQVMTEARAQASYSSPPPPSLPQRSSQRIATMQASLDEEHGGAMGGPSTSRQQLESKGILVPPSASSSRLGHLRLAVRVPAGLLTSAKALCWLAFLPAAVLLLYLLCRKEQCTVLQAPRVPWELSAYFHWKLYAGYGAFLLLQALVQALPLGRRVQGFPSKALKHRIAYDYALNGWANLLVTVGAFGALTYYGFPVTIPYRYSLQLLVTTLVFALVLSLALFVKGRWAPWEHIYPPGNSGNWLNDFVEGRELSPRVGKRFDLATLCFRCGLLTWVVLLGSMAWLEYNTRGCFDHSFALSAACQFLYVCMIFFDEEYFLASAFVTEDGLGYASVMGRLVLLPFLGALPAKFLLEHRPPTLRPYCLASIALVFLVGLVAMHLAHKRKYLFRRNWPDPTSRGVGMDYLGDGAGNRLMMSGLWRYVRHPNYLADLLCQLAFALPCGIHHVLPYYSVLLSTVFLVARTVAVERKCQDRYGDLWTRYTQNVKYRLVPFVF
ncbi:delta(14)-sterol reductase TM7SF2-like isoform X2 [Haemaphysalis longicornis]